MQPQHLAPRPLANGTTAALSSHFRRLKCDPYATQFNYGNIAPRNTQVSLTSNPGSYWHEAVPDPSNSDRRLRCPRASQCWPHSALSQPLRHAHQSSRKNMLWLHPSQSRLSQYTQASTSKTCRGQAHAPVLTLDTRLTPRSIPAVRGVSC
jgi:hypothetical protein